MTIEDGLLLFAVALLLVSSVIVVTNVGIDLSQRRRNGRLRECLVLLQAKAGRGEQLTDTDIGGLMALLSVPAYATDLSKRVWVDSILHTAISQRQAAEIRPSPQLAGLCAAGAFSLEAIGQPDAAGTGGPNGYTEIRTARNSWGARRNHVGP